MKLELSIHELTAIDEAIYTRVNFIKNMIKNWEALADENSISLVKSYSKDIELLENLNARLCQQN